MSHAIAQILTDKRANLHNQATALLDSAEAEGRDLNAAETEQWTTLNTDMDQLRQRIDSIAAMEQMNKDAEESLRSLAGSGRDSGGDGTSHADQLRAMFSGETRAFELPADLSFDQARALTSNVTASGGATVPTSFYGQLVQHMIESSGVLQSNPTILETTSGEPLQIPTTTAYGAGAMVAQNAALPTSDPAFAIRTLSSYKYGVLLQLPTELATDTGVNLEEFIAKQAGRAVGNAFGQHLAVGTGTNQPQGVMTAATAGVTGATGVGGAPTADNLIDLFFSVIAPYRNSSSAGWLMKDTTLATVRKLKDTTGQYLWQPSLQVGVPDTLLGKPVNTDPYVAAVGLNAKSIAFGDFSSYFARLVGRTVRFERSDEYAFGNDQISYRAIVRGDGQQADQTGAIKAFAGAAS